MDGVSPWKWAVGCHGDCVGHVISGSHGNPGEIKGAKQGKHQKGRGLISKLAKEEFLINFCFCCFSSTFSLSLIF